MNKNENNNHNPTSGDFPPTQQSSSDEYSGNAMNNNMNLVQQIGERGSRIEQQRLERDRQEREKATTAQKLERDSRVEKEKLGREVARQERLEREIRLERELSLERDRESQVQQFQLSPGRHPQPQGPPQQPQSHQHHHHPSPHQHHQLPQRESSDPRANSHVFTAISALPVQAGIPLRSSQNNPMNANYSPAHVSMNAHSSVASSSSTSSLSEVTNNSNNAILESNRDKDSVESPRTCDNQQQLPSSSSAGSGLTLSRPGVTKQNPRLVSHETEEIKLRLHRINSREVIKEMENIFGERRYRIVYSFVLA
jgi:hypothetical protein